MTEATRQPISRKAATVPGSVNPSRVNGVPISVTSRTGARLPLVQSLLTTVARHQGRLKRHGRLIGFDLPADDHSRIYLLQPGSTAAIAPTIAIRGGEHFEVDCTWTVSGGRADLEVAQFQQEQRVAWKSVPLGDHTTRLRIEAHGEADAVGFSVRLAGTGEVRLGQVDVRFRGGDDGALLPAGEDLLRSLRDSAFPMAGHPEVPGTPLRPVATTVEPPAFTVLNDTVVLEPGVDWREFENRDRIWQFHLQSFNFTKHLLRPSDSRSPHRARNLAALAQDWAEHHPPRRHSTAYMAWNDLAVAARTHALVQILGILRFESDPDMARGIAAMIAQHAAWLARDENYEWGNNHGLYSDLALHVASRALAVHPHAGSWEVCARSRFGVSLSTVISTDEGTVLEHSPAYFGAMRTFLRTCATECFEPRLTGAIADSLDESIPWFVGPDQHLVPLGDTAPGEKTPGAGRQPSGLRVFDKTGIAVVRERDSALYMVAGYHSSAHKHADELSIVMYEGGQPFLIEAGFPGYAYHGADREYGISAEAHNTLIINDSPFHWRDSSPYGSALLQCADHGRNWFSLAGYNPLLSAGVCHERTVIYSPGHRLMVIDMVEGPAAESAQALLHFADRLMIVETDPNSFDLLDSNDVLGRLAVWPQDPDQTTSRIVREPSDDNLLGVHYRKPGARAHHTVVTTRFHAPSIAIASLTLGPSLDPAILAVTTERLPGKVSISIETAQGLLQYRRSKDGAHLIPYDANTSRL